MGNIKKITIAVTLENVEKLEFLMSKIKFIEKSRVATGGMMSTPLLLMEFQGDEDTYHEKGYIVEKAKSERYKQTPAPKRMQAGESFIYSPRRAARRRQRVIKQKPR